MAHETCVPKGATQATRLPWSTKTRGWAKASATTLANPKKSVKCGENANLECSAGSTCCQVGPNNAYACCPYENVSG